MARTPISSRFRLLGLSLALASFATVGSAIAVSAYTPPGSVGAVTQGCPTDNSGATCTVKFRFVGPDGQPLCNATVNFTVSGGSVNPTTAATSCTDGSVQAAFTAGTTCGDVTLTATSGQASTQTTINVPCSSGGLPPTGMIRPATPATWLPLGLGGLALMVLVGGGLGLRRMRTSS